MTANSPYKYLFKIFLRLRFAQIPRLIVHNQLALTKFGRRLQYAQNGVIVQAIASKRDIIQFFRSYSASVNDY